MKGRKSVSRRDFFGKAFGAASAGCAAAKAFASSLGPGKGPNIVFIHTDQQYGGALSAHGDEFLGTPNLDRLVSEGVDFRRSYSANPVCCPSRACWYTGRPSTENGVIMNDRWPLLRDIPDLGQWFRANGYRSVYVGKWHVTGRNVRESFDVLTEGHGIGEHGDAAIARAAEGFLRNAGGDKPFFLNIGFLQPHDICYWLFRNTLPLEECPYGVADEELPPLYDNWAYDPREPEFFRQHWRDSGAALHMAQWKPWQWRYYRWAYARHVEMVDAHIGRVIDALDDSPFADNTLLVFSSDHGDGMGRHRMFSKMFFYEEAAHVPFIVRFPERVERGLQDDEHLVSGLDLAPTLCDFAGIDAPPKARGRSLRPILEGRETPWREYLVSEAHRRGRMVRTPDYKWITYEGSPTEQLFDMRADAGEQVNLAAEGGREDVIADHRRMLEEWDRLLEHPELTPAG